jgi:hypothetical protein
MSDQLKVFHVDDTTLFAARDTEHAVELYTEWCGEPPDMNYVREASDEYVDREIPEFDENEAPTGRMTTIRSWLVGAEPGFLAAPN